MHCSSFFLTTVPLKKHLQLLFVEPDRAPKDRHVIQVEAANVELGKSISGILSGYSTLSANDTNIPRCIDYFLTTAKREIKRVENELSISNA